MTHKTITLRESHDEGGSRHLEATLASDGTLTISGQDVGKGVEQFFGPGIREYEWAWAIQRADTPKLLCALGKGDDLLAALASRFSGDAAADLKRFLDENGIPHQAWSRVGID